MTAMFTAEDIITCNNCDVSFSMDGRRTVGCGCDPDAPTWVAVDKYGRVIALSYANYETRKK